MSATVQDVIDFVKAHNLPKNTEVHVASNFTSKQQFHFNALILEGPDKHWKYIPANAAEAEPPKLVLGVFANQSSQLPENIE